MLDQNVVQENSREFKMSFLSDGAFSREHVLGVKEIFERSKDVLHDDRNQIKQVSVDGAKLVVKSFKVPNALGRWIYTYIRVSKARRSFEYSLILKNKGVSVPSPLAYIEFFKQGRIVESYFVSEKFDYDCTMHEVLRNQAFDKEVVLAGVAKFAFAMHQKELMHQDFSPGNILVKEVGAGFEFALVDLNRMRFGPVSFDKGLSNFVRLLREPETVEVFARTYADCAGRDPKQTLEKINRLYDRYKQGRLRKEKLKEKINSLLAI